jgi:hypothetical protein
MAKKSDNAEIDQRVNQVYSLVLQCYSTEKIVEYSRQVWGINRAQTARYIQRARSRMMEVTAIKREEAFAEEMELRREIIRKALDDKKYQTALQAADSRAKLRGLFITLDQAIDTVTAHGFEVSDPSESAIAENESEDSTQGQSE